MMLTLLIFLMITIIVLHSSLNKKNNKTNRKWWHKRCWNNGSIKNFWRTLEMHLISCEINLQLKWSSKCITVAGTANNQNPTFQINDTYVSDITLSTQENIKLLKQLESGFSNWRWWWSKKSQAIISSSCGNKRL